MVLVRALQSRKRPMAVLSLSAESTVSQCPTALSFVALTLEQRHPQARRMSRITMRWCCGPLVDHKTAHLNFTQKLSSAPGPPQEPRYGHCSPDANGETDSRKLKLVPFACLTDAGSVQCAEDDSGGALDATVWAFQAPVFRLACRSTCSGCLAMLSQHGFPLQRHLPWPGGLLRHKRGTVVCFRAAVCRPDHPAAVPGSDVPMPRPAAFHHVPTTAVPASHWPQIATVCQSFPGKGSFCRHRLAGTATASPCWAFVRPHVPRCAAISSQLAPSYPPARLRPKLAFVCGATASPLPPASSGDAH
jgi:hypothetical protein